MSLPLRLSDAFRKPATSDPHPAFPSGVVMREHLNALLDGAASASVVLVNAPAAYGKTAVLLQWRCRLQARGQRTGWIGLDPSDRSTHRFARSLAAVLQDAAGGVGALPDLSGTTATEDLLGTLLELAAGVTGTLHLFLDDLQFVGRSESAMLLAGLLERVGNIRFYLAVRGSPGLPLGRLRLQGRVLQVEAHDLQVRSNEWPELLRAHQVPPPATSDWSDLERDADGWIGALGLLQSRPQSPGLEGGATLEPLQATRAAAEFFDQEVLSPADRRLGRFLLEMSFIAGELSPSLCDHVLGTTDSRQLLQACESQGMFLLPAGRQEGRYRIHRLLRMLLLQRMQDEAAGRLRELRSRAIDWLLAHEQFVAAFELACDQGDLQQAAQIMESHCVEIYEHQDRCWQLAEQLPDHIVKQYPRLMLAQSWKLVANWRFETAKQLIADAQQRIDAMESAGTISSDEARQLRYEVMHRESMFALGENNIPQLQQLIPKLLREHTEACLPVRVSLYTGLVYVNRETFQLESIDRYDALCQELIGRREASISPVYHETIVAYSRFMAGRLRAVEDALRLLLASTTRLAGDDIRLAAMPGLLLSEVLYEKGDLRTAAALNDVYLPALRGRSAFLDQAIAGWLTAARLRFAEGDLPGGFDLLQEAEQASVKYNLESLQLEVLVEQLRWLSRTGEADEVLRIGRKHALKKEFPRLRPQAGCTTRAEARASAWVLVAAADGRFQEGIATARSWVRFLADAGAVKPQLRWQLLLAHLHILAGNGAEGVRIVRQALALAQKSGFRRTLIDEGRWLANVLDEHMANDAQADDPVEQFAIDIAYAIRDSLGEALGSPHVPPTDQTVSGPLITREIEILRMVAAGSLNREIGLRLGMTEGSVKWYLQQIYGKLGERRRAQAVARARQLGFLR